MNIATTITGITIQVLACRSNCNLHYCYTTSLLSFPPFSLSKRSVLWCSFSSTFKCWHVKPLATWWNHFLVLLPFSFLIFLLHIPLNYFVFPADCWLELLGKRPFQPNKPTEQEGCTAVTLPLQIQIACVSNLMRRVSFSLLLFWVETARLMSFPEPVYQTGSSRDLYLTSFCITVSCSLIAKLLGDA